MIDLERRIEGLLEKDDGTLDTLGIMGTFRLLIVTKVPILPFWGKWVVRILGIVRILTGEILTFLTILTFLNCFFLSYQFFPDEGKGSFFASFTPFVRLITVLYIRTGQLNKRITGAKACLQLEEIVTRLKDLLKGNTLMLNGKELEASQNEYCLAMNGTPVRIERDENGRVVALYGGFQMENERAKISQPEQKGVNACRVIGHYERFLGHPAYLIDAPLLSTYRNVYSLMNPYEEWFQATDIYKGFFELCQADEEVLQACGLPASEFFTTEKAIGYNISFLEPGNYTLFVPTNEAVSEGLPTWKSIRRIYDEILPRGLSSEDIEGLKNEIGKIRHFVRSHFVCRSVFADRTPLVETVLQTCSPEAETVQVWRKNENGKMQLFVSGENTCRVVGEKSVPAYDQRVRERKVMGTVTLTFPEESASVVVHQIDGTLFR